MRRLIFPCLLLVAASCSKQPAPTLPPVPVTTVRVVRQTIPADFQFVGMVESSHIVELRARVEGYLEQISYQEGLLVKSGDLMFTIDQRPFIASLDQAKAELAKQKALLWNAKETVSRLKPLYEQNAVSLKDLDDAIAEELAANAQVEAAEANVMTAELNLSFTSITAPVTAMSNQAKFREGALISPGPNSLLTTLYVIDPIWVYFSVSDGDILKSRDEIAKNLLKYPEHMNFAIDVVLADGTSLPTHGKVDFTDPALQQNTGTMNVRAVLPNPEGLIRPGQFVQVVVKGAVRPNAIIVPQTSVLQGQKGMYVYVVDANKKAVMRPVEPGDWYEDFWIIKSGLQEGDEVIVTGVNKVQPDSNVTVTKQVPDRPTE